MHNRPIFVFHDHPALATCHFRFVHACGEYALVLARQCSRRTGGILLGLAGGLVRGAAKTLARGGGVEEAAEDGLEDGAEDDLGTPAIEKRSADGRKVRTR